MQLNFKHKNISVSFDDAGYGHDEDMLGDGLMTLDTTNAITVFSDMMINNDYWSEYFESSVTVNGDQLEDGKDFMKYTDQYDDWNEEQDECDRIEEPEPIESIEIRNADLQIVYFSEAFDDKDEVEITYESNTAMWCLHDMMHAENDVSGGQVYVNDYSEERAVKESLELCRIYNVRIPLNVIGTLATAFKERFKRELDDVMI